MTKPNDAVLDLTSVITWLENGCDPKEAVKELRLYQDQLTTAAIQDATEPPEQTAHGAGIAHPNLILFLPEGDKRQLLIKWDQTKEGVRTVCLQIKEAEQTAQGDAELPPLPEWTKMDDLAGLVPSEIRTAMHAYGRTCRLQSPASDDAKRLDWCEAGNNSKDMGYHFEIRLEDGTGNLRKRIDQTMAAQAALKEGKS